MTSDTVKQEKDITDLLPSNLVSEMEINITEEKKEIDSFSNEEEIDVIILFYILNRNLLLMLNQIKKKLKILKSQLNKNKDFFLIQIHKCIINIKNI